MAPSLLHQAGSRVQERLQPSASRWLGGGRMRSPAARPAAGRAAAPHGRTAPLLPLVALLTLSITACGAKKGPCKIAICPKASTLPDGAAPNLAEVQLFDAAGGQVDWGALSFALSSTYEWGNTTLSAGYCNDGATNSLIFLSEGVASTGPGQVCHSQYSPQDPRLEISYPCAGGLSRVVVHSRDDCCGERIDAFSLEVVASSGAVTQTYAFSDGYYTKNYTVAKSEAPPGPDLAMPSLTWAGLGWVGAAHWAGLVPLPRPQCPSCSGFLYPLPVVFYIRVPGMSISMVYYTGAWLYAYRQIYQRYFIPASLVSITLWYIYRGYTNGYRLYFTPGGGARARRDSGAAAALQTAPQTVPVRAIASPSAVLAGRGSKGSTPVAAGRAGAADSRFLAVLQRRPACLRSALVHSASPPLVFLIKMIIHRCTPPHPDHTGCNRFPIDCNRSQSIAIDLNRSQSAASFAGPQQPALQYNQ
ncbi:MAG: hypothetical protein J3K34DRAFT_481933 [Monoraphidium minutum]|nr:MAG: hypothetical protein J3K34DRAFT_481933 [Monoraphidium minutum]